MSSQCCSSRSQQASVGNRSPRGSVTVPTRVSSTTCGSGIASPDGPQRESRPSFFCTEVRGKVATISPPSSAPTWSAPFAWCTSTSGPAGIPGGTGPDETCAWFWRLPASQRTPLYEALMFPDSTVRARLDSTVSASGLRNTGELSAALSREGYPPFTSFIKVTMPTLVIAGRLDGALVPRGLQELTERLPNATFVEYDRSGHFVYLDEPDRFVRDVTSFIAARAAPKAR